MHRSRAFDVHGIEARPLLRNLRGITAATRKDVIVSLVVLSIFALLAYVVHNALLAARSIAIGAGCQSDLKFFGVGLMQYAEDPGYLCSGAFDWQRDGDVRSVGWAADVVNHGYGDVSRMKCRANPVRFSAQWERICADGGPIEYTAGDLPSGQRIPRLTLLEAQEAYRGGYNTNYVATWYLTRTAMKKGFVPDTFMPADLALWERDVVPTSPEGRTSLTGAADAGRSPASLANTYGPLALRVIEEPGNAETYRIMLLGDASAGDPKEASLTYCGLAKDAVKGDVGGISFTGGPVVYPAGFGGPGRKYGQDFTAIAPVHRGSKSEWANAIFADCHVSMVCDRNRDGFIGYTGDPANPGESSELERIYCGPLLKWTAEQK